MNDKERLIQAKDDVQWIRRKLVQVMEVRILFAVTLLFFLGRSAMEDTPWWIGIPCTIGVIVLTNIYANRWAEAQLTRVERMIEISARLSLRKLIQEGVVTTGKPACETCRKEESNATQEKRGDDDE